MSKDEVGVQAPEVLFTECGRAGVITLNRPKALNAVTLNMVDAIAAQLDIWAKNKKIGQVIIKAAEGRAFSAGGDIVQLYEWGKADDPRFGQFYRHEYLLNIAIKRFPKPYIALIDGIVMGGGVGVSFHGSHRVVSENLLFAMPETGIGLFPDVGGSYFLPRCPGAFGMYLGLTGERVKAADALYLKLATHYVPADKLADLQAVLCQSENVDETIEQFAKDAGSPPIAELKAPVNQHFRKTQVADIFASLASDSSDWAAKTLKTLQQKSPTSLMITHRQLLNGVGLSFERAMAMEYRMVSRIARAHDFREGTRAMVIDKDKNPKWQPDALQKITKADIDAYFAPLEDELPIS